MRSVILFFLVLLVAGCQSTATAPPTPISFPSIGTTPEFEALVISWVLKFRDQVRDEIIQINTFAPMEIQSKVQSNEVELIITSFPPHEGWFVTPLTRERVEVVVNRTNGITDISFDELRRIFSGQTTTWDELSGDSITIQPIVPLQGDSVRTRFESLIMIETNFSANAIIAPTPEIMLELIEEKQGSIGLILNSHLNDRVRRIDVTDLSAQNPSSIDEDDHLTVEILAISMEEPTGTLREFLIWLQSNGLQ